MSVITRSDGVSRYKVRPAFPLEASRTWCPSCSRMLRRKLRTRSSSSTIRMDAIVLPSTFSLPHSGSPEGPFYLRCMVDVRFGLHVHFVEHLFLLLGRLVISGGLHHRLRHLPIPVD